MKKNHKKGDIVRIIAKRGNVYDVVKGTYYGINDLGYHKVLLKTGEIIHSQIVNIYTRRNTAIEGLVRFIRNILSNLSEEIYIEKKTKKACKRRKKR